jgi:hypothetical protein
MQPDSDDRVESGHSLEGFQMIKGLAATLAVAGAVWFLAPAPANAATRADGIANATQTDLSAQRRYRRHRRAVRVYSYPSPAPYGYYGPTYYERPYRRPAPVFFGLGGYW